METKAQLEKRIENIKRKKLIALKKIEQYKNQNKIEYFVPPPDDWIWESNKTCFYQNPPQKKLIEAWSNETYKIFTFTGGNRTGKSTIGVAIAFSCLFGYFPWDKSKTPINDVPYKVLIIGQKWDEHIQKTLIPKLKEWWPKNRLVKTKKNNQGVDSEWIDITTGSVLHIMSNRQEPDAFEGSDYDLIICDEPPREEIHEAATRGLIDRGGRQLFTATLLKEPWVNRQIINARNEDGTPDRTVYNVHAHMTDNIGYGLTKYNVDEYKRRYRNKPELLKARVDGIPSYMSGIIYPEFKRELHLKKRFRKGIPLDWLVDISIDIHPKEPQAVVFVATCPRNYKYVIHEIFEHGSGKYIAQKIIKIINKNQYRINKIVIDPFSKGDSNNPEGSTFEQMDRVFSNYGYYLDLGSKDLDSGIILVKEWLMSENDEPALFFFDDLVRTFYEIEGWMWDPKTGKPIDKDDHLMENLRRAIQLETRWYPMEDEDEDFEYEWITQNKTVNSVTGY